MAVAARGNRRAPTETGEARAFKGLTASPHLPLAIGRSRAVVVGVKAITLLVLEPQATVEDQGALDLSHDLGVLIGNGLRSSGLLRPRIVLGILVLFLVDSAAHVPTRRIKARHSGPWFPEA